jgi:hypothetical protein
MTTNVAQIVLREVPRLVVLLNASYEETVRQSDRLVPVMDLPGRNDRQARERRGTTSLRWRSSMPASVNDLVEVGRHAGNGAAGDRWQCVEPDMQSHVRAAHVPSRSCNNALCAIQDGDLRGPVGTRFTVDRPCTRLRTGQDWRRRTRIRSRPRRIDRGAGRADP